MSDNNVAAMPSINIQFHMLLDELIGLVSSRYQLGVELEQFFPQAFRKVPLNADLIKEVKQFGQLDRIWLLYKTPKSKTPEKFMLNVGRQRGKRLGQAQLGAGTRKVKTFELLKKVATDLKRRTAAGIWVITETGKVAYVKGFRISQGAASATRA